MQHFQGFTLVELVVAILLVAILAIAIYPRFSESPLTLDAQAQRLAGDIRYAQSLSMTRGQRYCVFLVQASASYQLRTSGCSSAVSHPASGSTSTVLQGVSFTAAGLSTSYIEFDTKGQPTTISPVTSTAVITLSADANTRRVNVSGVTGRVIVQ